MPYTTVHDFKIGVFQKPATAAEEKKEEKAPSPAKKAKPAAVAAAAATGTADVKEIVVSFDTTGSMYPCLTQVSRGSIIPLSPKSYQKCEVINWKFQGWRSGNKKFFC